MAKVRLVLCIDMNQVGIDIKLNINHAIGTIIMESLTLSCLKSML